MKGAKILSGEERHVEASLLFALTMTTEEIISFYTTRKEQLTYEINKYQNFIDAQGHGFPPSE